MQTVFNLPAGAPPDIDAGDVHEWLTEQGFAIEGVAVRNDQVRIETVDDSQLAGIEAAFAEYQGQLSAKRQIEAAIRSDAIDVIRNIKNKGPANWTQTDKVILAIALELRALRGAMDE